MGLGGLVEEDARLVETGAADARGAPQGALRLRKQDLWFLLERQRSFLVLQKVFCSVFLNVLRSVVDQGEGFLIFQLALGVLGPFHSSSDG